MTDAECVALLRFALPQLRLCWSGFRRVRRTVCRRIARRMRALGIRDAAAYRARLRADPAEWDWLDAACRIPISRFHRDRGFFHALESALLPALAERALAAGRDTLRVWSAGCASGEEPYSVALLWQSALATRFPALRLEVVATDAEPRLLERARSACYRASSLRGLPDPLRAAAFERRGGLHCLRPEWRANVSFAQQDLRAEMPEGPFDLVLCRNLAFTYFAPALQAQVLDRLVTHLAPGGALAIGLHETLPEMSQLAPWPGVRCAYRRGFTDP
jgi:chemotaxis protein methyltransferase CheR